MTHTAKNPVPLLDFILLLRNYEIRVGLGEVLDFYKGLEKGLARNLDDLFIFAKLVFVKRPEHLDRFERAFSLYFFDIDLPRVAEGDPELLYTKQFREWLEQAIRKGEIPRHALWSMSREELMKKFWERVREQMEAHHGGNRWVGTGGTSPFGHSGFASRGVRVFGQAQNRSALKVIGDRRYVEYDGGHSLQGSNIRQVLGALRRMVPVGPRSELDIDRTIWQTARNGGEIELEFERQKRDRIKLILLIDNGGSSMLPYVKLTQLLFSKVKDRFKDCQTYFFHNTIYNCVYKDARRLKKFPLTEFLTSSEEARLFIVGDASMAPEELVDPYGIVHYGAEDPTPSIQRLESIAKRFKYTVWLNPIVKQEWNQTYGAWTLNKIKEVFFMEELTTAGIRKAVAHLRRLTSS